MPISGGLNANAVLQASMTLTVPELLALNSSPKEIIPAPGIGKILSGMSATVQYLTGTCAFLGGSGILSLVYDGDTAQLCGLAAVLALETASDQTATAPFNGAATPGFDASNTAIMLRSGADYGARASVVSSSLDSAGSLFAPGDTFEIEDAAGNGVQGEVDTVGIGGDILTYHLTNNGSCCQTVSGISISPTSGIGVDASLNLVVGATQTGTMRLNVAYMVIDAA